MTAASGALSRAFPLFTAGSMVYGAFRSYNNYQDTVSPATYLGISLAVNASQNGWALLVPVAASPNVAGIGVGIGMLAAATVYQGAIAYAAMKAGEEIGVVARQPNRDDKEIGVVARQPNRDDKEISVVARQPNAENRELR